MSERKQTPDILAEILGGAPESQPPVSQTKPPTPRTSKPARPPRPSQPKPVKPPQPANISWEYRVVSLQYYNGWRPRYLDGKKIKDWESGPLIHEYLEHMGGLGWELVSASSGKNLYGQSDFYQLFFKRLKSE